MLSQLLSTIREHALLASGDRVLVGLSGGPDSTALLHALCTLASRLRIEVRAVVIDHGLRPESADEARMVARRARALGVTCTVVRVDVRARKGPHVSWQDAARRARLGALKKAARRVRCNRVALGHTADDQAETVLFRILRGTGLRGLAGIPYRRDEFVRPLLDLRRAEIIAYLAKRQLAFVTDPSNADPRFTRARLRHDILPILARENPRVVEALLTLSASARAEQRRRPQSVGAVAGGTIPAETSRRARSVIARLQLAGAGTARVAVPGGEVEVSYGQSRFVAGGRWPATSGPATTKQKGAALSIRRSGRYRLPGSPLAVELRRVAVPPPASHVAFDFAVLAWPLTLRFLRPGDRMRPRGGIGSRKLQDLLVDAKVPRGARAQLPVLADAAGNILLVPGLRPSQIGRPGPATRAWLRVSTG